MKTIVCIEVEHDRPIPKLENLIAGRAWSIDGVKAAEVMRPDAPGERRLRDMGFSHDEIRLGMGEVVR